MRASLYYLEEVEWAIATRCARATKLGIDVTRPLARPSEKFGQAKILANEKIARVIDEMRGTVNLSGICASACKLS